MAQKESNDQKLVTPVSLVVDLVLVVGFFAYMYGVIAPHVMSNDPKMIHLWGGLTTACMTGVFWLCIQMFRVTLKGQRAARKK